MAARVVAAAFAARRVARHRERVRRAGGGQCAASRGRRTSSRSASASRTSRRRRTCAGRGDRGDPRRASTATRRARASTNCARRRHATWRSPRARDRAGRRRRRRRRQAVHRVHDRVGDRLRRRRRGHLSGARLPDLRIADRRQRRGAGADVPARVARLRVRPGGARGDDHARKTRLVILNTPHNPTGGILRLRGPRRDRRDPRAPSARLGVRRRDLFAARLRRPLRVDRDPARHARAHRHQRRRVEDLGDDRMAHRLCRQSRAGAGVHALDHEHGLVRVADLAVGRRRGAERAPGRRRADAHAFPRAARPHRGAAQRACPACAAVARRRVLRVAQRHRSVPGDRLRDSEAFRKRLLHEAGVAVLADIHFGRRVPGDGQHIRFSYAASNEAIKEGVRRMAAFVRRAADMSAEGPPGDRPPGGSERSSLRGDHTAEGPPRGDGGGKRTQLAWGPRPARSTTTARRARRSSRASARRSARGDRRDRRKPPGIRFRACARTPSAGPADLVARFLHRATDMSSTVERDRRGCAAARRRRALYRRAGPAAGPGRAEIAAGRVLARVRRTRLGGRGTRDRGAADPGS